MYKFTQEIPLDSTMSRLKKGWSEEARRDNVETLLQSGYELDEAIIRANRYAGMTEAISAFATSEPVSQQPFILGVK